MVVASIDLAALSCHCGPRGPHMGTAETLMSEELGIPLIEAHKAFCGFETYLDRALDLPGDEQMERWKIANASGTDHSKTWEQITGS